MDEIIKRLQKAEGPSRELDGEIFALCGGSRWRRAERRAAFSPMPAAAKEYAPYYTKSFDAALTLVPDGSVWGIVNNIPGGLTHKDSWHIASCYSKRGKHQHAAIALCIAALRALNDGETE